MEINFNPKVFLITVSFKTFGNQTDKIIPYTSTNNDSRLARTLTNPTVINDIAK